MRPQIFRCINWFRSIVGNLIARIWLCKGCSRLLDFGRMVLQAGPIKLISGTLQYIPTGKLNKPSGWVVGYDCGHWSNPTQVSFGPVLWRRFLFSLQYLCRLGDKWISPKETSTLLRIDRVYVQDLLQWQVFSILLLLVCENVRASWFWSVKFLISGQWEICQIIFY